MISCIFRMPGKRWADGEQLDFLEIYLDEYVSIQLGNRKYKAFWARIRDAWFERWPELDIFYPGKLAHLLTDEEARNVSVAMDQRIKVLVLKHVYYYYL